MPKKKYFTEEERKAARKEQKRQWYNRHKEERSEYYQNNKEKIAEYNAEYRKNNRAKYNEYDTEWKNNNKEKIAKYNVSRRSTSIGRAEMLLHDYKFSDKLYNRGECTLTAEWIVQNIFSEPCHYCGKTDWHELGCDRIDNSLPHTPDNVVPCCYHCNCKKHTTPYDEYLKLIGKGQPD